MTEVGRSDDVLEKCIKDVLSVIKPLENDRNLRLQAIQELKDAISSVGYHGSLAHLETILHPASYQGFVTNEFYSCCGFCTSNGNSMTVAAVKPFGSFVSNLYAKSGDLDVSVELQNNSYFPTSKEKKQDVLTEVLRALRIRGVAGDVNFIPTAKVPIIQYVSKTVGISCDVSVDNYPGRIKSKVFYWINTLDDRFGDMVLLIKEWAKAQGINDPKNGTLNSYSLCLLVVFHFQTCKPAILPPLKEIYDINITENAAAYCNEKHIDEICSANIAKFRRQNPGQKNQSSLSHLLATFFQKFSCTVTVPTAVISTFEGRLKRIQDMPYWAAKSSTLFIEDPFEKPVNAARAVSWEEINCISSAFNSAKSVFVHGALVAHQNELLSLLCTPEVGKKLSVRGLADPYTYPPISRFVEPVAAKSYNNQYQQRARGFTRSRPMHSTQGYNSGQQAVEPCQNQQPRVEYTSDRQANRHVVTKGYGPPHGLSSNASASDSRSQASSSSQHGNGNHQNRDLTKTDGPRIQTNRLNLSDDDIDMLQFLSMLEEKDMVDMLPFLFLGGEEDDDEEDEEDEEDEDEDDDDDDDDDEGNEET